MKRSLLVNSLAVLFRLLAFAGVLGVFLALYALYALVVNPAVENKEIDLEVRRAYLLKQVDEGNYREERTNGNSSQ